MSAHAEADRASPVALGLVKPEQVVDSPAQILFDLVDRERHHELAGIIGAGCRPTVIHVRSERDEPLLGEAIGHVRDVIDEPPPLLNHEDAGPAALPGRRQVPATGLLVRGELNHLA